MFEHAGEAQEGSPTEAWPQRRWPWPWRRGWGSGGDAAEATDDDRKSFSAVRSSSPVGGYWDEFPISEFMLTLYQPIKRTQWLPRAVADALEGDGPFRFLIHRVGARQGPWEVLARVVVNREG